MMLVAILFTIIGLLAVVLGGVAGIFLLRYSVGLWHSDIDEDPLRWITSGGLLIGCGLILLGSYFW